MFFLLLIDRLTSALRKYSSTNLVLMNSALLAFFDNIAVIRAVPKFHPPTAREVFKAGYVCFNLFIRSYL